MLGESGMRMMESYWWMEGVTVKIKNESGANILNKWGGVLIAQYTKRMEQCYLYNKKEASLIFKFCES